VSLITISPEVVKLPIPKDYLATDNDAHETAEMALERVSAEKLSNGILLLVEGKDHGKVIFG
jgi:hypothetical protein